MFKYLIMLTFCVMTQRTSGKSLFDYNINPEYDLVAEESNKNEYFWPSSEFYGSPVTRSKHRAGGRPYGRGNKKGTYELPPHAFDLSDGYNYHDLSEEYSDETYHFPHPHHHHGIPPGQAKKQGYPYGHPIGRPHGHPPGHPHGHPHEPPRRFPPPPVYDKDFINPWVMPGTTFTIQQPPLTTSRPFIVQQPSVTIPDIYVAPKLTTKAPPSTSTAADDKLMYDIDVRFGRD